MNRLNTAAPGIVTASKAVIYGTSGEINTLSKLQLNGSDVTASASEINILDGVTVDHTKINMLSGVTSSIQDQLDDKIDASSVQSNYAPISLASGATTITTVGALTTGSIASGFGDIDVTIKWLITAYQVKH